MAMAPTHAFVGFAVADLAGGSRATGGLRLAGAICGVLPDVDVLVMREADLPYDSAWGHRGILHGLPFACALGVLVAFVLFRGGRLPRWRAALALVLAAGTHGVLDALTTGGLGVAFLAPFSYARTFFAWRPIPVAGLTVAWFFTPAGLAVFGWELLHIWLPPTLALVLVHAARRRRASRAAT